MSTHAGKPLYVAVDCGATRSRYCVFETSHIPLARGVLSGANFTERGADGVQRLLGELLTGLPPGREPDEIAAVILAMAGGGRPENRSAFARVVGSVIPPELSPQAVYLCHDGESALFAAYPEGVGIVAIAGTGSLAFGREASGETARAGGWGRIAGDEGSAYWIAIEACRALFQALDGRGEKTALTELILRATAVEAVRELVGWLHARVGDKEEIAALAGAVSEAAEDGDTVARRILKEAGHHLAQLAEAVMQRLSLPGDRGVAIFGSVLTANALVREAFHNELVRRTGPVEIFQPAAGGELGAARLLEQRIAGGVAAEWYPGIISAEGE